MPTALITGTNRGIGLALSREFLKQGWHVLACCRKPESADQLQDLSCNALEILPLDVGSDDSIASLTKMLGNRPIDLLLNNAGIAGDQEHYEFGNMSYHSWGEIFRINTMAPMKMMEALPGNL